MSTNENNELCRFCHEKFALFVPLLQNPHVLNEIESFLLVKIEIDDESPNVVCYRCLYKIESGLEMREQCLKAEHGWRQNIPLAQLNYSLETSSKDFDQYLDGQIHVNVVDPNKDYESDSDDNNRMIVKANENKTAGEGTKQQISPKPLQPTQPTQLPPPPPIQLPPAIRTSSSKQSDEYRDEITELKEFNITLCKYCDKSFTNNEARIHHENFDHNTKIPYMCNECFIGFRDFVAYSNHLKVVHQNERPFQCVDCQRCFSRRTELRKHSVVHTGLKPFKCTYCEKAFSRNTNLMKHVRLDHSNLRPFGCNQCPKRFNSKSDVSRHVSMTHVNNLQSSPPAPAIINGYHSDAPITDDFSEVEDNVDDKIVFGADFIQEMNNDFDHDQQRKQHNNRSSDYLPVPEHLLSDFDVTTVQDNNCYYEPDVDTEADTNHNNSIAAAAAAAAAANNSNTLNGNETSTCPKFVFYEERKKRKYVLKNQEMLNRHFCQVCLRRFSSKKALRFHMLRHKGQTALICNICHKKFIRKKDFDRHLISHTGGDPSALYLNSNHFANNLEQIDTSVVV